MDSGRQGVVGSRLYVGSGRQVSGGQQTVDGWLVAESDGQWVRHGQGSQGGKGEKMFHVEHN